MWAGRDYTYVLLTEAPPDFASNYSNYYTTKQVSEIIANHETLEAYLARMRDPSITDPAVIAAIDAMNTALYRAELDMEIKLAGDTVNNTVYVPLTSATSFLTNIYYKKVFSTAFSVTKDGEVTINNGSITIKDSSNNENFSVKTDGTLKAQKGTIGSWSLGSSFIANDSNGATATVGMFNSTGDTVVFWAGGTRGTTATNGTAKFRVTANGALYSTNCTISGGSIEIKNGTQTNFKVESNGTLTANLGKIGNWSIGSNYIGNASTLANSTVGLVSSTTSGDVVIWAGGARASAAFRVTAGGAINASNMNISGGTISVGTGFSVSNTGYLQATGATIGGTLTAGANSKIGNWSVVGNILRGSFTDNALGFNIDLDPSPSSYPIRVYAPATGVNRFYVHTNGTVYSSNVDAPNGVTTMNLYLTDAVTASNTKANVQYIPFTDSSVTNVGVALKSLFNVTGYSGRETNIYFVRFRNRFMCYGMDYYNGSNSYKSFICIPSNESSTAGNSLNQMYIVRQVEGGAWKQAEISLTWTNV